MLVECAGRPAGDSIVDLIELVHGVDLYAATERILAWRRLAAVIAVGREVALHRVRVAAVDDNTGMAPGADRNPIEAATARTQTNESLAPEPPHRGIRLH